MSRRHSIACGLLLMLAIGALALSSCRASGVASGSTRSHSATADSSTAVSSPSESPSADPTSSESAESATTFPLTGAAASGAAAASRPVLAVAVPVGPGLPAPTGLQAADIVYAGYPAGDAVRYLALFQSQQPARVGPVGPAAPEDGRLLDVMHPLFAFNDGPKRFVHPLSRTSVVALPRSAHAAAYTVTSGKPYATPSALLALASPRSAAPVILLPHSRPLVGSGVRAAHTLTITMPGRTPLTWRYDAKPRGWRSTGTGGATPTNVIVQVMPYRSVLDRNHGTPVRSPVIVGTGSCRVVSLDQTAGCTWSKPGAAKLTNYVDAGGFPLQFAPGPTWVLLVPPGSTVKTG
ncbi:MAG TPA: DUF3048 C-terminal domain-containing protein [Mycobacteriales bacterium]